MTRSDWIALGTLVVAVLTVILQAVAIPSQGVESIKFWNRQQLFPALFLALSVGTISGLLLYRLCEKFQPVKYIRRLLYLHYASPIEAGTHTVLVDRFFPQEHFKIEATRHAALLVACPDSLMMFRDVMTNEHRGSVFLCGLSEASFTRIMSGNLLVPALQPDDVIKYEQAYAIHIFGFACFGGREETAMMLYALRSRINDLFAKHSSLRFVSLHSLKNGQDHMAKLLGMRRSHVSAVEALGRTLWVCDRKPGH